MAKMYGPPRTFTPAQDYTVYCHVCRHPEGAHKRSTSMLHGTPHYGALWHCPEHTRVKCGCPHGTWCDPGCKGRVR
jgi:hypothetical protein